MFSKIVLAFCAQSLLLQGTYAQCITPLAAAAPCAGAWGAPYAAAEWDYAPAAPCAGAWGAPYAAAEWDYAPAASLSASNSPGVAVSTASPLAPAGVSVLSENAYEGTLAVEGALPFLGTVAFEGALPTAGAGVVAYTCGNGVVGITAENNVAVGLAGPLGYGAGLAGPLGYESIIDTVPFAAGPYANTLGVPIAAVERTLTPVASLSASNGPGLAVSSTSPLIPKGVSVQSENAYEGALAVGGAVPFLGTLTLEGAVPTVGAGAIAYGCGNGAVGITTEDIVRGIGGIDGAFGLAAPLGIAGWDCRAIY